jgi:hypothetical protein
MTARKVLLGAFATCLIAVGVAAQTGTVHLPRPAHHAQKAIAKPQAPVAAHAARSAATAPTPKPAAAPPQPNTVGGGDGEGDDGD